MNFHLPPKPRPSVRAVVAVDEGVAQDGEQPRPDGGTRLERAPESKRANHRVLHQILGAGGVSRVAKRRPVEAVEVGERGPLKGLVGRLVFQCVR